MRQVLDQATGFGATEDGWAAALSGLLELAARWTPAPLASILTDAMELAAWEGREHVFLDDDEGAAFAITPGRLPFKEQIDFLRQKRPLPTRSWLDAMHGIHDRAFVVAGVTDTAMLEEFQTAIIDAAENGRYVEDFAKDFDRLVEKYGWSYKGEREWRIRTIFETNIRTSFMAGRLKQMRDPDVVKLRPYWQYLHGDSRTPKVPRKQHLGWHGLVLMWNDPWWDTHFPPNDWLCSCGVRTLSRRSLERLGKTGPDEAPRDALIPQIDRATGQLVMQPMGIGKGWDYMPGDHWERGLVPSALLQDPDAVPTGDPRGRHVVSIDQPEPIADLLAKARPFQATVMPEGLAAEDYIRALLQPLGGDVGRAALFEDKAGHRFPISGEMFFGNDGRWKGYKRGHASYAALIAEALADPDEIWLGVREVPLDAHPGQFDQALTRRYIRADPGNGLVVMMELGRKFWREITGYAPLNRSKPDMRHLDAQRIGKLVWKRK
ncbi:PBECR2 nuclease fold domain-containing protein [Gemmobacter sp. 24YEA27]|uniref:PBECR2 nuclease fold domain-containing protein n=1 Tax=Gemmobacter sp. 24YEA27 TaxID=3040672 RepID=UPI0024B3A054|nr:PBECR2 nuclease fold domain-containing protein [Gemmobacter sp. 24YEA27]